MKSIRLTHILPIIILILLSSCSVFKFGENHTKNKLKRANLEYNTLDTKNYKFTYWDTGESDKPVLVLFHGFGTSTHLQWYQQAKMLSKTHRLILPNLLYFGSTPKGQKKYGVQEQAAAMSILLKELKIDSMILGGLSYGGAVATELTMLEKDKVQKLAIFASPVKFFKDTDLSDTETKFDVKDISELLVPKDIAMTQKFADVVLYKDKKLPKFILKDVQKNLFQNETNRHNCKAILQDLEINKKDLRNRKYQFDCPVLLIWGEDDELIPARIGKDLKDYLPTSELCIIPKAGHCVNIEQKKMFNKALSNFLKN